MRPKHAVALLLVLLVAGCAMLGGGKPFAEMTYAEKGTYFQEVYNKQFDDALAMSAMVNPPEAILKVYRVKRALLVEVKPLIATYAILANNGGIPTPEQEAEILVLINRLILAAAK